MITTTQTPPADPAATLPTKPAGRPDLADRRLLIWVAALVLAILAYLAACPSSK